MQFVSEDPELGKYYRDEETGISAFEKTKGGTPRFCAWLGAPEDFHNAPRTPWADSMEEALGFMEFQHFRCSACGKLNVRKPKKRWSDKCKDGKGHDWLPLSGKKKTQAGRKINMWMSDSQLSEIEELCAVTGNDKASTIRDLIALGLKCRRQMENLLGSNS
ncbi:MAG: hypothetical protein WCX65_02860 [bacterium]